MYFANYSIGKSDWSVYQFNQATGDLSEYRSWVLRSQDKLPELLRGVQSGKHYTITLRGEAVADLVPAKGHKRLDAESAAENMRAFMRSRKPVSGVDLKALIDEGRA